MTETTTATMTHDLLDRAFVDRLRASNRAAAAPGHRRFAPSRPTSEAVGVATLPTSRTFPAPQLTQQPQQPADTRPQTASATVADRLLDAAASQWDAVAGVVERAIANQQLKRGDIDRAGFVLAVVCRRPKDGCTTFVDCLARTLRGRGTDVRTTTFDSIDRDCETVQIVDAGSWFGTGPIRRDRSTLLAEACDAVILLRRADRSTAAAFARALEVAGVRVLGEVTTFGRDRDPANASEGTA